MTFHWEDLKVILKQGVCRDHINFWDGLDDRRLKRTQLRTQFGILFWVPTFKMFFHIAYLQIFLLFPTEHTDPHSLLHSCGLLFRMGIRAVNLDMTVPRFMVTLVLWVDKDKLVELFVARRLKRTQFFILFRVPTFKMCFHPAWTQIFLLFPTEHTDPHSLLHSCGLLFRMGIRAVNLDMTVPRFILTLVLWVDKDKLVELFIALLLESFLK
mmetsp:Transcript_23670/g.35895  ORF Transcript_23670/g.35895 Transcript_23670/m.35895 type:complete len:212 (+) Transcript_23670:148-783(+)